MTLLPHRVVTGWLFHRFLKALPQLSATEQEAIQAGTVWWDRELFTGRPAWNVLHGTGVPRLSKEEQEFLDGPTEELCGMVDQWELTHDEADIPPHVIDFIKGHKFLGMIIPKEYGGLGFSALAQSEVLMRVISVGTLVGNFIILPNSLGPAELLMKYGTTEQKHRYLPKLAVGEEVPCFALTSPAAGSDATAIPDIGEVCLGQWEGREVIGMRLNFDKRYITLAPIATLVGLAFRLRDPNHLIGDVDDYGITCALIPRTVDGLEIGRRHLPVGDPFLNGPVRGKNVFVPLDCIIGGREMVGKGWRMLVECLSVGRGIGVPATATSMAKRGVAAAGAYARIRRQFKTAIAEFEGIQKPLARIAGLTFIIDAARVQTALAIMEGQKPAVPSAIIKYQCTELARRVINDAMDIHGGKAVMRGPKNYLASAYQGIPVPITVEGANILTRSLIIFGQGVIRSHPYVMSELELVAAGESDAALARFESVLLGHAVFTFRNAVRAFFHGLSRSITAPAPGKENSDLRQYYRHVNRLSAVFALTADVSMAMLGASLKRREMISARLGDLLSMLYLVSMVLKQYRDRDCPEQDLPMVHWACNWLLNRFENTFFELLDNFPGRLATALLRVLAFPTGRQFRKPSDQLDRDVAGLITRDSSTRRRLVEGVFLLPIGRNPLGILDKLLADAESAAPVYRKIKTFASKCRVQATQGAEFIELALEYGAITREEAEQVRGYEMNVNQCIQVDDFEYESTAETCFQAVSPMSDRSIPRSPRDTATT